MHTATHHTGANLTTITTQMGEILQIPSREVAAALSPLRTVTLKPLVTTSGLNVSALSGALGLPVKALQVWFNDTSGSCYNLYLIQTNKYLSYF